MNDWESCQARPVRRLGSWWWWMLLLLAGCTGTVGDPVADPGAGHVDDFDCCTAAEMHSAGDARLAACLNATGCKAGEVAVNGGPTAGGSCLPAGVPPD